VRDASVAFWSCELVENVCSASFPALVLGPFESIDRIQCNHFLTRIIPCNSLTKEVPSLLKTWGDDILTYFWFVFFPKLKPRFALYKYIFYIWFLFKCQDFVLIDCVSWQINSNIFKKLELPRITFIWLAQCSVATQ